MRNARLDPSSFVIRVSDLIRHSGFGFLILTFLTSSALASSWLYTDADFQSHQTQLDTIDAAGLHTVVGIIPWDNVLEISHAIPPTTVAPAKFTLAFRGGDRLSGEPVSFDGNAVTWKSPALGQIAFPVDSVLGIARAASTQIDFDQPRTDDVVRLSNGDSVHGIVNQIAASGIVIQAGDATPTLPWDSVDAVLFSSAPSTATAGQRMFRVHLPNDESLTVSDLSLSADTLTVTLADKSTRQFNTTQIAGIEQINGPVAWLTSLKPTADIYKPFFSENFPTAIDRTVGDHIPIREKFPAFHHGIGCHSYSKLTYALDPQWAAFRTQFILDSNSPLADVTVRIYLDDKQIFEQKNIKAGRLHPVVGPVPLDHAKSISLEVDYGQNYATEDRFVWLDPALLRKPPEPTTAPSMQP